MINFPLISAATDPDQDKDEDLRKDAVAALRRIDAAGPDELAKTCALLDDSDARNGIRERRSDILRGRLAQLREQDAADAAAKAAKAEGEPPRSMRAPAPKGTP